MDRSKTPRLSEEEPKERDEEASQQVICKKCKKSMAESKLVTHLSRAKKCQDYYGGEFLSLKAEARRRSVERYTAKNKDKIREKQKVYGEENREEENKRKRKYREENKEKIRESNKIYYLDNRIGILERLREKAITLRENSTSKDRILRFRQEIIEGQNFTCLSCQRCLFKRSVRILTEKQEESLISKCGDSFYYSMVSPRRQVALEAIFCFDCAKKIAKKIVPKIHVSNGLELDPIPQVLKDLPELEQQLIAKVQVFMKLKKLPSSRMSANDGRVINVLMEDEDIEKTITSLPTPPDKAGIVPVKLKRKMSLKSAYAEAYVNPEQAVQSVLMLKELGNPHYIGISIDEDFLSKVEKEVRKHKLIYFHKMY